MQKTAEKYTVITGASSGIGHAAAEAFAARGKNLILTARRRDILEKQRLKLLKQFPALDIAVHTADLSITENAFQLYEKLGVYRVETWINNAGFGHYGSVAEQDLKKIGAMLRLNVESLAILSSLFARDCRDAEGAQLINISSAGGYTIVPDAVTYCATKFFVGAFTEGLARELMESGAKLRAKVLAPAATETGFGKTANDVSEYDYKKSFGVYHTSRQMAAFLLALYDSDKTVGVVDRKTFTFQLRGPLFPYAGDPAHNQRRGSSTWHDNAKE